MGDTVTVAGFVGEPPVTIAVLDGRDSPVGKSFPGTTIYAAFLASFFCCDKDTDAF